MAMSLGALPGCRLSALTLSSAGAPSTTTLHTSASALRSGSSNSSSFLHGGRLMAVVTPVKRCHMLDERRRRMTVNAEAPSSGDIEAEAAAETAAESNPVAALKLQSELLKKKAKRLELRRKRLVRKRHLRKKGRWPPSKMRKNKNV